MWLNSELHLSESLISLCKGLGDAAGCCQDDAARPHTSVPPVSSNCAWSHSDAGELALRQAGDHRHVCSLACQETEQE